MVKKASLRYRGYSIEDLAENTTFMEVAYLLIYGDLPQQERLDWFQEQRSHAHAGARKHEAVL